jgi:MFS family permease
VTTPVLPPGWAPGDPAYRRITLALFLAGLATFALVYCTQPLLPLLADAFDITPAASTLSLSVTTMAMGVALLVFGPLSDAVGRLALMRITLLIAALIAVASAFAPSWWLLLTLRATLGFAVAGLPAVATAYLREEIHPDWATSATGLYIGGTAIGGMSGRLITGLLAQDFGWRVALGGIGVMSVVIAIGLGVLLPSARRFHPHSPAAWRPARQRAPDGVRPGTADALRDRVLRDGRLRGGLQRLVLPTGRSPVRPCRRDRLPGVRDLSDRVLQFTVGGAAGVPVRVPARGARRPDDLRRRGGAHAGARPDVRGDRGRRHHLRVLRPRMGRPAAG